MKSTALRSAAGHEDRTLPTPSQQRLQTMTPGPSLREGECDESVTPSKHQPSRGGRNVSRLHALRCLPWEVRAHSALPLANRLLFNGLSQPVQGSPAGFSLMAEPASDPLTLDFLRGRAREQVANHSRCQSFGILQRDSPASRLETLRCACSRLGRDGSVGRHLCCRTGSKDRHPPSWRAGNDRPRTQGRKLCSLATACEV